MFIPNNDTCYGLDHTWVKLFLLKWEPVEGKKLPREIASLIAQNIVYMHGFFHDTTQFEWIERKIKCYCTVYPMRHSRSGIYRTINQL